MNLMTARTTIALLLLLTATTQPVAALCTEPTTPSCADDLDTFGTSDQWEFDSCRSEIEQFKSEVEDYIECVKRQISDMLDAYNEQVRKYNCKIRRERFCL